MEQLRNPTWAAAFAGVITALYIIGKARLNNEGSPTTSAYIKPAALVAILVYFIVSNGIGRLEPISTTPF
tara:strand:- start:12991 stop:13200 length:210 start_codon:yes stop_codon:yes gene_type:complete